MRKARQLLALAAIPALALVPTQVGAHGSDHHSTTPKVKVISTDVMMPFSLDVGYGRRGLLVADGFTSTVSRVTRHGLVTVATGPQPGDVSGLARSRDGKTLAYTTLADDGTTTLEVKGPHSAMSVNLSDFEKTHNPDGVVTYGVPEDTNQCAKDYLAKIPEIPAPTYKGQVDSHAYSVASLGHGAWAVGEAGGNDLLKVNRHGDISVIGLLPPQPHTFTAAEAAGMGAPDCLVGVTFAFEPVPTDIEVGKHGWLYVTTLPGGPEGPALGARGSVYRVNPWTGSHRLVATGFAGATNLALGRHGSIYVTELFGGKVSVIKHGKVKPYVWIDSPLSVESLGRDLYVGTLVKFGPQGPEGTGSIVKVSPGHRGSGGY
jgi:hypothetical protein